jgi:putative membrane protein
VGVAGMLLPFSFPLFVELIPFALLLSAVALLPFHTGSDSRKTLYVFFLIFVLGYFVEVAGVNTRIIFGAYRYGSSLGIRWLNTPLMIGLNWCLLLYVTSSVTEKLHGNIFLKITMAATLMLAYDMVLEQVAPKTDMWYWDGNVVPFQNFVAWFVISLVFHTLIKIFRTETENKMAMTILISQFIFFFMLAIFL